MDRLVICSIALNFAAVATLSAAAEKAEKTEQPKKTVVVGAQAPQFSIKDSEGKRVDLKSLSNKGPVLVRLTCGCKGCDKELAYFQALHEAYKDKGLVSIAVFREPDAKVEAYVKEKKLKMLYAIDPKGESWNVFQTKTMPTNFLIEKGGRIKAIAAGCDPSGLVAEKLAKKVAGLLDAEEAPVKKTVDKSK